MPASNIAICEKVWVVLYLSELVFKGLSYDTEKIIPVTMSLTYWNIDDLMSLTK